MIEQLPTPTLSDLLDPERREAYTRALTAELIRANTLPAAYLK